MDWKDVKGIVAKLAPMIATALGGPLAGGAVAALEAALGIETTGTLDQKRDGLVVALGAASADQLLAIKKAEQDYAVQMSTLGFKNVADLEGIASADRDSARKREIAVKDNTPKILAYAVTVGYFVVLAALMLGDIPSTSKEILYIMLGTLGTAWIGVINYYYGSTSGSAEKTKIIAASTPPVIKD